MFDLEKSIANWRKQMVAAGIEISALDELESHLRDDIDREVRLGTMQSEAFESAVRRLGQPAILKKEFMIFDRTSILRRLKGFILGTGKMPLPPLDEFEPAARQALELAPMEARRFRHDFVGTEHLLLGLTESGSEVVTTALRKLDLDLQTLRLEIERFVPVGANPTAAAQIPYTPRAREALHLAAEEARKLNQSSVKPEHILLGLLREGGGVAALVLKKLNVQLNAARTEILRQMSGRSGTA